MPGLSGRDRFFAVPWWFSAKPRATGAVSGMFLIGYGAVRFVAEFFREPDAGIFGLSYTISMGQRLSLPMIAAGVAMLVWSARRS
jgi:phosphatidylglycerol:prolipoprotein diacylglycerol transferase